MLKRKTNIFVTILFTFVVFMLIGTTNLFGLTGDTTTEIIEICTIALRIASIGYIFMGFSVAVQGVLQALGYAIRPLLIALFRLVIFVFPTVYIFTLFDNVTTIVWWAFPIAEFITAILTIFILKKSYKEKIETLTEKSDSYNE